MVSFKGVSGSSSPVQIAYPFLLIWFITSLEKLKGYNNAEYRLSFILSFKKRAVVKYEDIIINIEHVPYIG